jgi:hypothetical protein
VTLIVGFKCYEGVVIVADSQETLTVPIPDGFADYRCKVDKIIPQFTPNYTWVIGGSGDTDLINGFTDRFADSIWKWEAGLDAKALRAKVTELVESFYAKIVPLSTAYDRSIAFILSVKANGQGHDPLLWRIGGPCVISIDSFSMIGWEEGIYRHFADRLYKGPDSGANRALLVGLYLMMLGKSTSNVIGGPTKAIKLTSNAVQEIPAESIVEIEKRIESFARILEDVTLWCPDASVPNYEFPGYLDNIEKQLMALREKYFGATNKGIIDLSPLP